MDLLIGTIGGIVIGTIVTLLSRDWVLAKVASLKSKLQAWKGKRS